MCSPGTSNSSCGAIGRSEGFAATSGGSGAGLNDAALPQLARHRIRADLIIIAVNAMQSTRRREPLDAFLDLRGTDHAKAARESGASLLRAEPAQARDADAALECARCDRVRVGAAIAKKRGDMFVCCCWLVLVCL